MVNVVPAPTARLLGLVHELPPPAELARRVDTVLQAFRAGAPISARYVKEAVQAARDTALAAGLRVEADLASLLQTTSDRAEGLAAFIDRRAPTYRGR